MGALGQGIDEEGVGESARLVAHPIDSDGVAVGVELDPAGCGADLEGRDLDAGAVVVIAAAEPDGQGGDDEEQAREWAAEPAGAAQGGTGQRNLRPRRPVGPPTIPVLRSPTDRRSTPGGGADAARWVATGRPFRQRSS